MIKYIRVLAIIAVASLQFGQARAATVAALDITDGRYEIAIQGGGSAALFGADYDISFDPFVNPVAVRRYVLSGAFNLDGNPIFDDRFEVVASINELAGIGFLLLGAINDTVRDTVTNVGLIDHLAASTGATFPVFNGNGFSLIADFDEQPTATGVSGVGVVALSTDASLRSIADSAGLFGLPLEGVGEFDARFVIATVPLPAGAPLLLAGIGALALMRRRKRRA